jgi:FdhE protein
VPTPSSPMAVPTASRTRRESCCPFAVRFSASAQAAFETLAASHPMADFLRTMGAIAHAQQDALVARRSQPVADAALAASRDYGMPPLSAQSHERSAQWRDDLRDIAQAMKSHAGGSVASALDTLSALDTPALEALADRVLAATRSTTTPPWSRSSAPRCRSISRGSLPRWTRRPSSIATCPASARCARRVRWEASFASAANRPICATWSARFARPSGISRVSSVQFLRHRQRRAVPGGHTAGAKADRRPDARRGLRRVQELPEDLLSGKRSRQLEPYADDLATLALDLLVDEQGFARSGPNLLFHPGSG